MKSSLLTILKRAAVWAFTGGIIGVAVWGVVGGTSAFLYSPQGSMVELVQSWSSAVLWTGFWALFVAAIAFPVYVVVLAGWQKVLQARPQFDATAARQFWSALVLSAPLAAIVTLSFAGWGGPFPLDWMEAARIFPIALVSCWGAVYLPRRVLRSLRAPLELTERVARE